MSDFCIERVGPADWQRVRTTRLHGLADAPDAFGRTLAEEQARPDSLWSDRLSNPATACFLAVAPAGDVGIAFGRPWDDREGCAGLFGMWVAPAARGQGISDALIDAVIAWARAGGYRRL